MNLASPTKDVMGQEEPNEIVITDSPILVEYSHNLVKPVTIEHKSPNGFCFSRAELINILSKQYIAFDKQENLQFKHEQLLLQEVHVNDNVCTLLFCVKQ